MIAGIGTGDPGDYRVRVLSSSGLYSEGGTFKLSRQDDSIAKVVPGSLEVSKDDAILDWGDQKFKIRAQVRKGRHFHG